MAPGRAAPRRRTVCVPVFLLVVALVGATACSAIGGVVGGAVGGGSTVRTPGGTLQGVQDDSARRFMGIRYAEAPVGPRRWADPVPAGPWSGTRQATGPGPACPQTAETPASQNQDEDCLFLNVTTPNDVRPGEKLPVFLWWHGGGFMNGSGAQYDAQRLARQGRLAVVTANYRLGTLGYFGLPGLPDSGAFGFADQLQSLRWTKENIASFGGDPDNVTVAGESAGGASTCALLGSPALTELAVTHVVVMSGTCSTQFPNNGLALTVPERGLYAPAADVQSSGQALAAAMGCTGADALACMRAKPVDALLPHAQTFSRLAYGSEMLPADPASRLAAVPPSVPVLLGGMHDEGRSFFFRLANLRPALFTPASYLSLLQQGFGPDAGRVLAQYPLAAYQNSAVLAWSTVVTDSAWSCAARRDQESLVRAGVPTYGYEFDRADGPPDAVGIPTGGAPHATELILLFDQPQQTLPPSEVALSGTVIDYWSSFARTGRPESASGPVWTALGAGGSPLQLDPRGIRPVDTGVEHRCDFWATVR